MRRLTNPRNATPEDHGGAGETDAAMPTNPVRRGLQGGNPQGRSVGRVENERRATPGDFGGIDREYLITIRKFDAATGEEVWNNGRGESDSIDLGELHSQCSQLYSLGSSKFLACGSPTPGKLFGNLLHWADLGSSGAIVKASIDETADSFDCTSREAAVVPLRMAVGDDHVWLCGRTTASGTPRVIQAYDRTTLQSAGALTLSDDDTTAGADASYLVAMAATASGDALVARVFSRTQASPFLVRREIELSQVDATPALVASGSAYTRTLTGDYIEGSVFGTQSLYVWLTEGVPEFTIADEKLWLVYLAWPSGGVPRLASIDSSMTATDHGELPDFPTYNSDVQTSDLRTNGTLVGPATTKMFRSDNHVFVASLETQTTYQAHKYDFTGTLAASWEADIDAVDQNGSCFAIEVVSFANKLVRRDSGVVVWQASHDLAVDIVFTSGGNHYCIGSQGVGGGDDEIFKISGSTGEILWSARHSDGASNSSARDIIVVGDYVYVVGEGSTYEPA